ncbi:MAG: PleD family two-component system response regulator [Gaiellaceae bacterium]
MSERPLVVVADDEEDILMLVDATLRAAGFDVMRAQTGVQALELVRAHAPRLAVLDVSMPELDGLEVLQRLRGDEATASLPIVLLSALAQESDVARGYELGASKYLRKPFRPSELIAIARELAAQPGGE